MLVGGIAANFGRRSSYRLGGGRDFVIEGDEYDSAFFDKTAKFLKYLPDIAVVGNIEYDHADIYPDLDAVRAGVPAAASALVPRQRPAAARRRQPARPRALVAVRAVARSRRSALTGEADWHGDDLRVAGAATRVQRAQRRRAARARSTCRCSARTTCATRWRPSPSAHDARHRRPTAIVDGLRDVPRREAAARSCAARSRGVTVYDDFAHHPTAIVETLAALRAAHPEPAHLGGLRAALGHVVPHASSRQTSPGVRRRRRGRSSRRCSARACPRTSGCRARRWSADINARGVARGTCPTVDRDIVDAGRAEAATGDLVVVMSNGGFDGIHDKLLDALRRQRLVADGGMTAGDSRADGPACVARAARSAPTA